MRAELFARLLAAAGCALSRRRRSAGRASLRAARQGGRRSPVRRLISRGSIVPSSAIWNFCCRAPTSTRRASSRSRRSTRAPRREHEFDPELSACGSRELTLKLPTVREFAEDVPDLASLMLAQLVEGRVSPPRRLAIASLNALRHYSWPGNLAELESVVKDLALHARSTRRSSCTKSSACSRRAARRRRCPRSRSTVPTAKRARLSSAIYFEHLLAREHGSMSRVAERSGLERTHLYRKLKALGLPVGRREDKQALLRLRLQRGAAASCRSCPCRSCPCACACRLFPCANYSEAAPIV